MKKIKARYNCGYWIWDCSVCNSGNRISKGSMAICGHCYKDKTAGKFTVINGVIVKGIDKVKQDNAKRLAYARNEVYQVSFPRNKSAIEDTLRVRREEHQSWEVGETIEDLKHENKTHPDLTYLEKEKPNAEPKIEIPTEALPHLDEKILRRIL